MTPALDAIFGNRTAAWTLLFLQSYGEAYAKRVADTFDIRVNLVQSQLRRLEEKGVALLAGKLCVSELELTGKIAVGRIVSMGDILDIILHNDVISL